MAKFDEKKELALLEKACNTYNEHLQKEKTKISDKLKALTVKYNAGVSSKSIGGDIGEYKAASALITEKQDALQDIQAKIRRHKVNLGFTEPQEQLKSFQALEESLQKSEKILEKRKEIGMAGKFWEKIDNFMKKLKKDPKWTSTIGVTGAKLSKNIHGYFDRTKKQKEEQKKYKEKPNKYSSKVKNI